MMMIWKIENLVHMANRCSGEIDGVWVPSRPIAYRPFPVVLRALWLVLRGRADVVVWPGQ